MTVNYEYRSGRVYLRLRESEKKVRVQTQVEVEAKYWNQQKKEVRRSHVQHNALNAKLLSNKRFVEKLYKEGIKDMVAIQAYIKKHGYSVVVEKGELTSDVIADKMQGMAGNSNRNHKLLINKLLMYSMDKPINMWKKRDLIDFEYNLKKDGASINYVARLFKDLKAVLNYAIFIDLIKHDENPFNLGYKIRTEKYINEKLEIDEVKKLKKAINRFPAVKVWFLCFYSDGTRVSDVLKWKTTDIKGDSLIFMEGKTGKVKQVEYSGMLKSLIDSYEHKGEYILPYIELPGDKRTEQKRAEAAYGWMNKQLKTAADYVGIEKNLTMHMARNTYSYIAVNNGYDILDLQQTLNHSSIQTTRNYIGTLQTDRTADKRKKLHKLI